MRAGFYIHWIWYIATLGVILYFSDVKWTKEMSTLAVISCQSSLMFLAICCAGVKYISDDSSETHKLGVIATFVLRWVADVSETWYANIYEIYTFPDKYLQLTIAFMLVGVVVFFDVKKLIDKRIEKTLL